MSDISNLRHTIVPKSDQLNSEQLIGGPMTVTVCGVKLGGTEEQPLIVHYEGDNGRPYKPCKTMRKVLIFAWGEDGREWVGRAMTLYNDPTVRFGGAQVGGIRISHMSHIDREIGLSLTATKGKKAAHTIKPLLIQSAPDLGTVIDQAESVEQLKSAFETAYKSTKDRAAREQFKARYDARMARLMKPAAQTQPAARTLAQFKADIEAATDTETAALALDAARDSLTPSEHTELSDHFTTCWEN